MQQLCTEIVETAANPEVAGAHLSAAINALRSIFQTQSTVGSSPLGRSLWHDGVWLHCFTIFLDRANSTKGKTMRQFLGTLISMLQDSEVLVKKMVSQTALSKVLRNLHEESSQGIVKSSLYAFGFVMSKGLVPMDEVLDAFQDKMYSGNASSSTSARIEQVKLVYRVLFDWAQYPELAPVAGQASCNFSRQLRKITSNELDGGSTVNLASLWILPLLQNLRANAGALQSFQFYVFPELFAMNISDYYKFLCSLDLHAYISNDTAFGKTKRSQCEEADSNILFAALQIGKETGLVLDSGQFHSSKNTISMDVDFTDAVNR
jgi:hypothetical protein